MTAPKLTGGRCQCAACGEYFNSDTPFGRHRVGSYAKPGEWQGNRRCLTPAEMTAKGWQPNAAGFWITQPRETFTARAEDAPTPPPATWMAAPVPSPVLCAR